ncbi:Protein SSUH2 -like protein [Halotydeus destructor]|nr:Protein SSUH2 -like protein [Halotydeus destructor]
MMSFKRNRKARPESNVEWLPTDTEIVATGLNYPSAPPPENNNDKPPSYDQLNQGQSRPTFRPPIADVQFSISETELRDALQLFAKRKIFFTDSVIKKMKVSDSSKHVAHLYTLETFTEKRSTMWAKVPWYGQEVDGTFNGTSPGAWEIPVEPEVAFQEATRKVEVPHSASIQKCERCTGSGRMMCQWCHGDGRTGGINDRETCTSCNGSGKVRCKMCKGHGRMKVYTELTISWTVHRDHFIFNDTTVPDRKLKKVSGNIVFDERAPRVSGIDHFPNKILSDASIGLIDMHTRSWSMEKTLEQRHFVKSVPIVIASYIHPNRRGNFFVYGLEHKVYFPNYPSTCFFL